MSAGRIAAAAAAVALAALALWRRRRLGAEKAGLALLTALALAVYASGALALLPDPKQAIIDVATALGPWTYALVGVLAFLETGAFVGLIAPGETVVIAGGVIAGQGEINLVPLIGLVWTCAVLGDTASFMLGRRLGRAFVLRHGARVRITPDRLEQVETYFERHGGKTILIGRFIGLVRALAPFVAGSSGFAYRRFIPYSIVGCGLWGTLFAVLGYLFWQSFDRIAALAGQAAVGLGVVVGLVVGVLFVARRLRDPARRARIGAWLDRQQRRAVIGPPVAATRALGGRAAAAVGRVVSVELLELTTAIAVAGVGAYVCTLYALIVSGDPGPTGLDERGAELAGDLRTDVGVDALALLTDLGAFPTVAALLAVTAAVLAMRGRRAEGVVLIAGLVAVYLGVQLMKAGIGRPRPAGGLVAVEGKAYPSGHAAYSTAWVAAAVAFASQVRLTARAALVLGSMAVCAMVGLSRVYLGVHWPSDVWGGWALGFGAFGVLAAISLVIALIRHNGAAWTST